MYQALKNYPFSFFCIFLSVFILLHLEVSPILLDRMFNNFNKLALGTGAIIGALFGSNYLLEKLNRKSRIKFYSKKYPHDKHGDKEKGWILIRPENRKNEIWLLNYETLQRHHIVNMTTLHDLTWQGYERPILPVDEFYSYDSIGDRIRTKGEIGQ